VIFTLDSHKHSLYKVTIMYKVLGMPAVSLCKKTQWKTNGLLLGKFFAFNRFFFEEAEDFA